MITVVAVLVTSAVAVAYLSSVLDHAHRLEVVRRVYRFSVFHKRGE